MPKNIMSLDDLVKSPEINDPDIKKSADKLAKQSKSSINNLLSKAGERPFSGTADKGKKAGSEKPAADKPKPETKAAAPAKPTNRGPTFTFRPPADLWDEMNKKLEKVNNERKMKDEPSISVNFYLTGLIKKDLREGGDNA